MRRPRHRANGEGTTYPRREGGRIVRWDAVLVVGWTLDGHPVRRSRSASSEPEAKALLAEMRRARDAGDPVPDFDLTTASYLRRWIVAVTPHVRPTTARSYRFTVGRFLLPELGAIPLRRLRAAHVIAMLDRLTGSALSPHTVAGARQVLRRALADAERDRLVDHNAAALVRGPGVPARSGRVPTTDEVRAVLVALAAHRLAALFAIAVHGLRLGEVTGLRWVDVELPVVHVRLQLQLTRDPAEPFVLAPPKTAASIRDVTLTRAAVAALAAHRTAQKAERIAAGSRWEDASGLVFTTASGGPLHPNTVRWVLAQAIAAAGVAPFGFHSFRRFAATIAGDVDLAAAKALLGHTDERLTDRKYAASTAAASARATAAIEEALG